MNRGYTYASRFIKDILFNVCMYICIYVLFRHKCMDNYTL